MTTEEPRTSSWLWPLLADLACVLALAVGGKGTHDADKSAWVVLAIAWHFALAAGLSHAGLAWRRRQPRRVWPDGAVVLVATYGIGMLLRALSGRGLAPGFLVVAALFLAVTMLGWRGLVLLVARRRARRAL